MNTRIYMVQIVIRLWRECCIAVCMGLFKAELKFRRVEVGAVCLKLVPARSFYSSRLSSYIVP
jgi:hypothetical protein